MCIIRLYIINHVKENNNFHSDTPILYEFWHISVVFDLESFHLFAVIYCSLLILSKPQVVHSFKEMSKQHYFWQKSFWPHLTI